MLWIQSAKRPWLFWIIAAFVAAATINILPLPLALLIALTLVSLLLIPRTPLAMLVVLLVLSPLRTLIATESSIAFPLDIGQILLVLYLAVWLAYRIIRGEPILRLSPEPVFLSVFVLCFVFAFGVWRNNSIANWLTEWLKWVVIAVMIWQSITNRAVDLGLAGFCRLGKRRGKCDRRPVYFSLAGVAPIIWRYWAAFFAPLVLLASRTPSGDLWESPCHLPLPSACVIWSRSW